jgi:hypothetical protein
MAIRTHLMDLNFQSTKTFCSISPYFCDSTYTEVTSLPVPILRSNSQEGEWIKREIILLASHGSLGLQGATRNRLAALVTRRERLIWELYHWHAVHTMSKKRLQLRFDLHGSLLTLAGWLNNRRERKTARLWWDVCASYLCGSSNRRYANDQQQRCRYCDRLYSYLGWHTSLDFKNSIYKNEKKIKSNFQRENNSCKSGGPDKYLDLDSRFYTW